MRELDEKRVVVLPVLVEDCEIPIFLREKMYADLRKDFDQGLLRIRDAIAKVTNADQGRIEDESGYSDWAVDWNMIESRFHMRFTIVNIQHNQPMTLLTHIDVFCNDVATNRYLQYMTEGLDWIGRAAICEPLFDAGEKGNYHIILDSQFPKQFKTIIADKKNGSEYKVIVESRRLGLDNGKDQLVNASNYLMGVRDFIRSISRRPTLEEAQRLFKILAKPWDA